ncbi:unnamed protein product, partial [Rotaria magnacalcarata]
MKSKDIQKVVKVKYENADGSTKIVRDLVGAVSLPTIKLWIKIINTTGSITLSSPPGCPRKAHTNAANVKDDAKPHTHRLTQEWCAENFPDFNSKERWPPNSPDLCPLDYSLWNDLGQCMNWNRTKTK